jgi:hypothetical protein
MAEKISCLGTICLLLNLCEFATVLHVYCGSILQSRDISLSSDLAAVRLAAGESPLNTSPYTKLLHINVITFCSVFAVKHGSMTTLIKNFVLYIWTVRDERKCLFQFLCSTTWTAPDYFWNFTWISDLAGIKSLTIKFRATLIVNLHFSRR